MALISTIRLALVSIALYFVNHAAVCTEVLNVHYVLTHMPGR